jgi:hypothetical protein
MKAGEIHHLIGAKLRFLAVSLRRRSCKAPPSSFVYFRGKQEKSFISSYRHKKEASLLLASFYVYARICSIFSSTSSVNWTPTVFTFSSTCSGRLASMRALATFGWRNTHASANWERVMSSSAAALIMSYYIIRTIPFLLNALSLSR